MLSVQFIGGMCHGFNLLAKPGRLWKRQGTGHSFNSLIRAVLKGHPITPDDVKYVYCSQRCLSFVVSCNSAPSQKQCFAFQYHFKGANILVRFCTGV